MNYEKMDVLDTHYNLLNWTGPRFRADCGLEGSYILRQQLTAILQERKKVNIQSSFPTVNHYNYKHRTRLNRLPWDHTSHLLGGVSRC